MTVHEEIAREKAKIIAIDEHWSKVKQQWDDITNVAAIILAAAMVLAALIGCNALVDLDQRIAWEDRR